MDRRSFCMAGLPIAAGLASLAVPAAGAELSGTAFLDAAAFGARGDGVADDAGALQAALDALPSGGTLRIPAGRYRVSRGLVLPPRENARIMGDGFATRIAADAPMEHLLRLDNFTGCAIDHLALDAAAKARVALRVVSGTYARMQELDIANPLDIAVHCGVEPGGGKSGVECMIENCRLTGMRQDTPDAPGSRLGLLVGGGWTDGHYNNLIVRGFVDTGVELQAASNILHEVHIYRSPCFQFKTALRVRGSQTYMTQCYFDNFVETGVDIQAGNVALQQCYFLRWVNAFGPNAEGPAAPGVCIRAVGGEKAVRNLTVIGCSYVNNLKGTKFEREGPLAAIELQNAENVVCVDSQYHNVERRESRASGAVEFAPGADRMEIEHGLLAAPRSIQLTPGGRLAAPPWAKPAGADRIAILLPEPAQAPVRVFWSAEC